jgi:hypothetical protein
MLDAELKVRLGAPLLSAVTTSPPTMDGLAEAAWEGAPTLAVPLHYGLHGNELAGMLELRSLHDEERIYFLAQWPSGTAGGEPGVWRNLLTVHWRLVDSGEVSCPALAAGPRGSGPCSGAARASAQALTTST